MVIILPAQFIATTFDCYSKGSIPVQQVTPLLALTGNSSVATQNRP